MDDQILILVGKKKFTITFKQLQMLRSQVRDPGLRNVLDKIDKELVEKEYAV